MCMQWVIKLKIEFIQSGVKDADEIISNINKIEKGLFSAHSSMGEKVQTLQSKNTASETSKDSSKNCIEISVNTTSNHLAKLIEEDRATAKAALKLIYQHQFATVDGLVQHMARLAYGDRCLKIDSLENLTETGKISRENGNNSSRSFCEE